jgi:hypothetical protein
MHMNFNFELLLDILFNFETATASKQGMSRMFDALQDLTNLSLLKLAV